MREKGKNARKRRKCEKGEERRETGGKVRNGKGEQREETREKGVHARNGTKCQKREEM